MDLLTPTAVGGVVDRQHDHRVRVHQVGGDEVQHDQAHGVDRPHRAGEEPVDPVMRPGLGQTGPGEHPTDRLAPGLGVMPTTIAVNTMNVGLVKTSREGVQQPTQRSG
jgi:hypothetical protein